MSAIGEILSQKQGQSLLSTRSDETVLAATKRMNEHGIGSLLVMDDARLVGIFTERDVLRRVVAEERQPASVRVAEVMTREVACVTPETSIDEARTIMRQRRIRSCRHDRSAPSHGPPPSLPMWIRRGWPRRCSRPASVTRVPVTHSRRRPGMKLCG